MKRVGVLSLAVVWLFGQLVEAQSPQCKLWLDFQGGTHSSPGEAAMADCNGGHATGTCKAANVPGDGGGGDSYNYQVSGPSCTLSGDGMGAQCSWTGTVTHCLANGNCYPPNPISGNDGVSATMGACPANPCTSKAGKDASVTATSGAGCSAITKDADGCTFTNSVAVQIGNSCAVGGTYTGAQDTSSTTPSGSGGSCITTAAGTACTEKGSSKPGCGTFNGDEVCVSSVPPGTCVSFASGGVACTASGSSMTSPPAPDNGTPGTPANPTAQVSATAAQGGTSTTSVSNYYSSTVVGGSSAGVASNPGGVNVGNGGLGNGSGGGTNQGSGGSAPSAANGDCGASGVDCGGDGSVPQLPQVKTMQQTASDYYASLAGVPIVAAVANLGGAFPSGGDCPTTQFSVFGKEFTLDVQCQLWAQYVGPIMGIIMLAVWTIVGVRIAFSA